MANYRVNETRIAAYVAGGTINAARFADHHTTEGQATAAGAGVRDVIGINKKLVSSGQPAEIVVEGETLLEVNAQAVPIAAGDPIKSGAAGVGVKADTDKDKAHAIAREAATADAVLIVVKINQMDVAV